LECNFCDGVASSTFDSIKIKSMRTIIALLIFTLFFCSCSTEKEFFKRKYTPGIFVDKCEGKKGKALNTEAPFSNVDGEKDAAETNEPISVLKAENKTVTAAAVNKETKPKMNNAENSKLNNSIILVSPIVLAIDTIPPQIHVSTDKEIKRARVWSTLCVAVLIASWLLLPVIGWIAFFLIQFCIGTVGMSICEYYGEGNDKYLNVISVLVMISLVSLILYGTFFLIYCTFFHYCG
jgi:hypothetical protein